MPDDLNALLPASLTVTFPVATHLGADVPRVAYTVTLASLALPGLAGVAGYPGAVLLRSSAAAGPGSPSANDAELLALARQVAADWYAYAAAGLDVAWAGVAPWEPEGLTDWLEVAQTPDGRMTTRVRSEPPQQSADLWHLSSRGAADDAPVSALLAVSEGERSSEGYYPATLRAWDAVGLSFPDLDTLEPVWLALTDRAFGPAVGSGSGTGSGGVLPSPLPDAGAAVLFPGDLRVGTPSALRPADGRTVYFALPHVFWALLTAQSGFAYSWRPLRQAGGFWEQGADGPANAYPANGSLDYPVGDYPDGTIVRMSLEADRLVFEDLAVFGAAGLHHSQGAVPDPGDTPHDPPWYLGDDADWHPPSGGGSGSGGGPAPPVFRAAGPHHVKGLVPDPGPIPHGPPWHLGDDARWHVPPRFVYSGAQAYITHNTVLTPGSPSVLPLISAAGGNFGYDTDGYFDADNNGLRVPPGTPPGMFAPGDLYELSVLLQGVYFHVPDTFSGGKLSVWLAVNGTNQLAATPLQAPWENVGGTQSDPRYYLDGWLQLTVNLILFPGDLVQVKAQVGGSPGAAAEISPAGGVGSLFRITKLGGCGSSWPPGCGFSAGSGGFSGSGGSGNGSGGGGGGGGGPVLNTLSCTACGSSWLDTLYLTVSGPCGCLNGTVQMNWSDDFLDAVGLHNAGYEGEGADCPGPKAVSWQLYCEKDGDGIFTGRLLLVLYCEGADPVLMTVTGGAGICPPGGYPAGGYEFGSSQSPCCPGGGELLWDLGP